MTDKENLIARLKRAREFEFNNNRRLAWTEWSELLDLAEKVKDD